MSTVAWDGRGHSIAADRQATCNDQAFTCTKIWKLASGEVVAATGYASSAQAMVRWYESGADPALFPECQKSDEFWTRLIVARRGWCGFYERHPFVVQVEDPFAAWGSGSSFALGALAQGATARKAVEVASMFDINSGRGIDSFDLYHPGCGG